MTLHMIKINDTMLAYTPILAEARKEYDKQCSEARLGDTVYWYQNDICTIKYERVI